MKDLYSLFTSRCDYLDENSFFGFLFVDPHLELSLEEFNKIMHAFVSKDTIDAFEISPLYTAMRMLHKSDPEARNGWEETMHHLLDLGPNLHVNLMVEGSTILDQIMDIAQSPFESQEVCEEWLLVLGSFGLDIEEYLQTERLYQYEGSVPILSPHLWSSHFTDDGLYRYTIFSKDSPRVSWDWAFDPEGHATEVIHEFRNLGPMSHEPFEDYQNPEKMFNWPYFYPKWQSFRGAFYHYMSTEEVRSSCKIYIAVFEKRFERRWLKRGGKLQRAQGIKKGPRVPGAWID